MAPTISPRRSGCGRISRTSACGPAQRTPGLGLRHSATVLIHPDQVEFIPDYLYEPTFRKAPPAASAFKADQTRVPREARRIPPWLRKVLT